MDRYAMRTFTFDGKIYRSMRAFCAEKELSYARMKRLCHIYERAHKDPLCAARWMLGIDALDPAKERKTRAYMRDVRLGCARQIMFRARVAAYRHRLAAAMLIY